ncbi:MAG TPA: 6-carboxytetrahydropterin synthase [Ferruginibacter sp.]|nr:6-carboxytetrahydropterin synthase [Ferruginibacter sp.]
MLNLTKIFHFEMAHAIYGYAGTCKNIHGHSYELHVTVSSVEVRDTYLPAPGFVLDFKEIKKIVSNTVIGKFDHKILLSSSFVSANPCFASLENLVLFEVEPTAENMLIYIQSVLGSQLPGNTRLEHLKLYETKDSYAEWKAGSCEPMIRPI